MNGSLQKYDRGLANGPLDRKLLRAAAQDLGPNEISRAVGGVITPAQAAQRVRDLLESRNWLTWFEQQQLLLESINEIVANMQKWVDAGSIDHIKATLQALKLKQDQLNKNRVDPEAAAQVIREGQARIMLQAIQVAMMATVDELSRRYPQIPEAEVREVFMLGLPKAVQQVEDRIEKQ